MNSIMKNILCLLPKGLAHSYLYKKGHNGKILNLEKPETYDEKIHWLSINYYDESFGVYADKIAVRDYVAKCGLKDILIPLCGKGVYESADRIDFQELPDSFILKCNHGSGDKYYCICNDKTKFDESAARNKLSNALRHNWAKSRCEYHYKTIKPAIICEQLLTQGTDSRMTDFKVVCSYGSPKAILVCHDRDEGRDYFSTDWKYLDYVLEKCRSKHLMQRPETLERMLEAASMLSKPFPLARVDFYSIGNRLFFGEITLTPSSGNHKNLNETGQREIGKMIELPK